MAGSEQNASGSLHLANDMAGSWRTKDAVLPIYQLLDAISSANLRNQLHDLWVIVASITADDKEGTVNTFGDGEEDGGNEGF